MEPFYWLARRQYNCGGLRIINGLYNMKNESKKIRNKEIWYLAFSPRRFIVLPTDVLHFGFIEMGQSLATGHTVLEEYETEEEMGKAIDRLRQEEGWYESYKLKFLLETPAKDDEEVAPKPVRARDASGKFIKDDPSTPDYNEAWEGGEAP